MIIDLNCDMGEGAGNDEFIMPYISSANIACGFHAGDDDTMRRTIELALKYNVAIGAHPGFDDKANFGRIELQLSNEALYDLISQQLNILQKVAKEFENKLHHVKPHGALYNMAAKDEVMSSIIAKAVKDVNADLILYGLSNSYLISAAQQHGLQTASEIFADRTYTNEGMLTPRTELNALIEDEARSIQQVLQMIQSQTVTSTSGKTISIKAETICIHGDGKHAVEFAKLIHQTLKENNIAIKAV